MHVNVREAKTRFSELLKRVAAGEEVITTKAGKPLAKLVPTRTEQKREFSGVRMGSSLCQTISMIHYRRRSRISFIVDGDTSGAKARIPVALKWHD